MMQLIVHCDPFFNGVIDEFRIHRGAMSAAQVRALAQGA
ncbi:LamG domain-containing protein [Burkholderia sp. AU33545]|nr:LamG domain-containing protein [Burkholderia sp. AU33545]MCA8204032.1 LamG domain-containing protein [Burkholderia sp. AU33545]